MLEVARRSGRFGTLDVAAAAQAHNLHINADRTKDLRDLIAEVVRLRGQVQVAAAVGFDRAWRSAFRATAALR